MEPARPSATPLKTSTGTLVAGGGEPPYDGGMEHRITALEARWDAILPTLATKADLAELGAELREGLHQNTMATLALRSELQQAIAVNMGELRTEMQKMNADIKTWTLATVLVIIGTMLAAIFGISQIYKTTTPPAPIIITLPAAK